MACARHPQNRHQGCLSVAILYVRCSFQGGLHAFRSPVDELKETGIDLAHVLSPAFSQERGSGVAPKRRSTLRDMLGPANAHWPVITIREPIRVPAIIHLKPEIAAFEAMHFLFLWQGFKAFSYRSYGW